MLVGLVNVWLLLPMIFLSIIFYKFRQFYILTARDVKRIEATSNKLTIFLLLPKVILSPIKLLFQISFKLVVLFSLICPQR